MRRATVAHKIALRAPFPKEHLAPGARTRYNDSSILRPVRSLAGRGAGNKKKRGEILWDLMKKCMPLSQPAFTPT